MEFLYQNLLYWLGGLYPHLKHFLKLFVEKDDAVWLLFVFNWYEFVFLTRLLFEVIVFVIWLLVDGFGSFIDDSWIVTCKCSIEFIKLSPHFSSLCERELITFMAAKSVALSIEFAIPICLMLLMKQIPMYAESSDEVLTRNTVYFGYENLFWVQISFNFLQFLLIKFGWSFW